MKFITGLVLGLLLGAAGAAVAATCVGQGYAMGWTVTVDGNDICDDPFIWTGTKEIECD